MIGTQMQQPTEQNNEVSLKDLVWKIKDFISYLKKKSILVFFTIMIGASLGLAYSILKKPIYTATFTFALDDEKGGSGSGLAGALGLANTLGIDLGSSAGSAFSGANLIDLMQSRNIVEKALLNSLPGNSKESLADFYIEFKKMRKDWTNTVSLAHIMFSPQMNRSEYTLQQDSILNVLYEEITDLDNVLNVAQRDKKVSIISIDVKTTNELFSKAFAESIAQEVSKFYIETKSKKAKTNVDILQRQVDSVRNELYVAISGVAVANDVTYNLNPAFNVHRIPSTKKQIDVQANTAILTQLVTNLEMAKVTLLKETPLIQVIDKPRLPLKKTIVSKLKAILLGTFLAIFICVVWLSFKKMWEGVIKNSTLELSNKS